MTSEERILNLMRAEIKKRRAYRLRAARALADSAAKGSPYIERPWSLAFGGLIESALIELLEAHSRGVATMPALLASLRDKCVESLLRNEMNGEGPTAAGYRDAFAYLIGACNEWLSLSDAEAPSRGLEA